MADQDKDKGDATKVASEVAPAKESYSSKYAVFCGKVYDFFATLWRGQREHTPETLLCSRKRGTWIVSSVVALSLIGSCLDEEETVKEFSTDGGALMEETYQAGDDSAEVASAEAGSRNSVVKISANKYTDNSDLATDSLCHICSYPSESVDKKRPVYRHNGGLNVVQALEEGVMVSPMFTVSFSFTDGFSVGEGSDKIAFVVPEDNDYIDDSALRDGFYRYDGIEEFVGNDMATHRVRRFVEITDPKRIANYNAIIEARKAADEKALEDEKRAKEEKAEQERRAEEEKKRAEQEETDRQLAPLFDLSKGAGGQKQLDIMFYMWQIQESLTGGSDDFYKPTSFYACVNLANKKDWDALKAFVSKRTGGKNTDREPFKSDMGVAEYYRTQLQTGLDPLGGMPLPSWAMRKGTPYGYVYKLSLPFDSNEFFDADKDELPGGEYWNTKDNTLSIEEMEALANSDEYSNKIIIFCMRIHPDTGRYVFSPAGDCGEFYAYHSPSVAFGITKIMRIGLLKKFFDEYGDELKALDRNKMSKDDFAARDKALRRNLWNLLHNN